MAQMCGGMWSSVALSGFSIFKMRIFTSVESDSALSTFPEFGIDTGVADKRILDSNAVTVSEVVGRMQPVRENSALRFHGLFLVRVIAWLIYAQRLI